MKDGSFWVFSQTAFMWQDKKTKTKQNKEMAYEALPIALRIPTVVQGNKYIPSLIVNLCPANTAGGL